MSRLLSTTAPRALAALAACALSLSACQSEPGAGTSESTLVETTSPSASETASEAPDAAAETSTTTSESVAPAPGTGIVTSAESGKKGQKSTSVKTVAEQYSELVPQSLFAGLDSCFATLEDSFQCSGPIGQFQFFESPSKAALNAQLVRELPSSEVVQDTGDRVVGWRVMGLNVIITVVDTARHQYMTELVSTGSSEPDKRIEELGLVRKAKKTKGSQSASTTSLESTPRTTATSSAA